MAGIADPWELGKRSKKGRSFIAEVIDRGEDKELPAAVDSEFRADVVGESGDNRCWTLERRSRRDAGRGSHPEASQT